MMDNTRQGRGNGQSDLSDNANIDMTVDEATDALNAFEERIEEGLAETKSNSADIERLMTRIRELEAEAAMRKAAYERARRDSLSFAERCEEDADKAGTELEEASPELVGLLARQYIDAKGKAADALTAEQDANVARAEYLDSLSPERRAREELSQAFGPKKAALLLDAVGTAKTAERKRLLKKLLVAVGSGAAWGLLVGLVLKASQPKSLKARLARRVMTYLLND